MRLPPDPTELSSGPAAVKNSHTTDRKQQKAGRKVDIHLKPQAPHTHPPSERPHSLADLKMYKDTKILVAKFLEHSSCSLPPDVQQVVNNIKCVIKLDEKHMEEAIFSANVIDQVTRSAERKLGGERAKMPVTFACFSDDESAFDGQSEEARAGGPSPPKLRRFELVPFSPPSQMPPAKHQRLGSPPRAPRTEPGVQGDHPLTAPSWRTPPAFQASCAVQSRRLEESQMAPAAEGWGASFWQMVSSTTGKCKAVCVFACACVCVRRAPRAESSAETVANLDPARQSLQWLPSHQKKIIINR